jgi:hypothetical protein
MSVKPQFSALAVLLTRAWVLWMISTGEQDIPPHPWKAFETEEACDRAAAHEQAGFDDMAQQMIARGEIPEVLIEFKCLPDTTDSHQPK